MKSREIILICLIIISVFALFSCIDDPDVIPPGEVSNLTAVAGGVYQYFCVDQWCICTHSRQQRDPDLLRRNFFFGDRQLDSSNRWYIGGISSGVSGVLFHLGQHQYSGNSKQRFSLRISHGEHNFSKSYRSVRWYYLLLQCAGGRWSGEPGCIYR